MSKYIIKFCSSRLGYGDVELSTPENNGIPRGITAIIGENGAGKSTLGLILEKGRYAFGNRLEFIPSSLNVKLITFSDIHSLSGMEVTYLNQRMEATMNEYVPTVREIMERKNAPASWMEDCRKIGLKNIEEKKINYLSSGELRKLLIVNALSQHPDLIVLDNPYIGLDAKAREEFNQSLRKLGDDGISAVLLLSDPSDIPPFTNHVMEIKGHRLNEPIPLDAFKKPSSFNESEDDLKEKLLNSILSKVREETIKDFSIAFEIKNGKVKYGDKIIFQDFDWKIGKGECWRLRGRNGSGKSLLLSMICADNPQAYSNDITLFDRKRGSGESIFEIKDNIGYVSPEMQLYFKSNDSILEIVVQGLRNSLNRYHPSTPEEREEALAWLQILEIDNLQSRKFNQLSTGEQRLVLVARALIKQPALLVLDEPFHGLDSKRKEGLRKIIDAITRHNRSTLIFVTHYDEETPKCVTLIRDICL